MVYGVEIMIVGRTMWIMDTVHERDCTVTVTYGQTDGQMDRIAMTKTAQRIASCGNDRWTDAQL